MKSQRVTQLAAGRLAAPDGWFRYWMPYCFQELSANRKHVYLPLNREYKPLGLTDYNNGVDYDDYIDQAVVFTTDPGAFPDVWTRPGSLYLYNDGTASRLDYFERLERLLSRSVRLAAMTKIGRSKIELPNPQAWREIGARLRAGGRSTRQVNESREVVWLIRRWNADQRRLHKRLCVAMRECPECRPEAVCRKCRLRARGRASVAIVVYARMRHTFKGAAQPA